MSHPTPHAAIAAPNRAAADAATRIARSGGNAVDIALAAMCVAMTTEPGIVSSMGGAFLTVWPDDGPAEVIDGNVQMAGKGRPASAFGSGLREVRTTYGGGLTLFAGHGSVAVPGAWAGMGRAHERHGSLPWAEVIAPAIDVARAGFVVGTAAASYLNLVGESIFGWDEGSRARLHVDSRVIRAGEVVVDEELAQTYEHIASEGWRTAYTGELARALVADMDARGGLVSHEDLAEYEPVVREALPIDLGEWQLATNPPPSVGGPMLALMLTALAARERRDWADIIDIQRAVLTYRASEHDLSADLEEAGWAALRRAQRYGLDGLPTSPNTANVSVVDSGGMACAITASSGYGSGAIVPGTGLALNNALGELELNRLGVHALAPGTPLASNMAPTVGRAPQGRRLAIGSPGADRITTALMQVVNQGCLHGQDLQTSVDAPRVHIKASGAPDGGPVVEHESDPAIEIAVARSGLPGHDHGARSMYFGGVGAAYRREDAVLISAGDPRRDSVAVVA
ncbi:gamma-glutamyltransferase [Janibacter sp. GXQ6167]|uniref:gamma-glutamyltransferase n=1 Tax=Janibacter sp. GXQ6167 TaxID=3240791 RepID=UPI0035254B19